LLHSKIDKSALQKAIDILKNGGVVAFPTDTVYGLGAAADNPAAIRRVFEIKQRPLNMALPLVLADSAQADTVAINIPEEARVLMAKFWPGALTLVLKKSARVPDILTAGSGTVAVRVPNHALSLALIGGAGVPLVGTSANVHGMPSPVTAEEVRAQLEGKVDYVIDGGRTPVGVESTIVDMTVSPPKILRHGAISREEIEKALVSPD
jgi:L-threonylcarbamoyladenylate synthase